MSLIVFLERSGKEETSEVLQEATLAKSAPSSTYIPVLPEALYVIFLTNT